MSNRSSYFGARVRSSNQKQKIQQMSSKALAGVPPYTHETHNFSKCSSLHTRQTQLQFSQCPVSNWSCTTDVSHVSNTNSAGQRRLQEQCTILPWEIANRRILFELAENNLAIVSRTSFGLLHQHPWASQVPEVT